MKKEDNDKTLKRVRYEISNGEDHGDQEIIRYLRAPSKIEGATSQRAKKKIAKSSYCQDHPDLIATADNNLIVHIMGTWKESKDHTRDLSKSTVAVLKTLQIEVPGSRK